MKTLFSTSVAAVLLTMSPFAHGQFVLNAGESYVYQFSSLPFAGFFPLTPQSEIGGRFQFTVNQNSYQAGDSFQFEMWEHDLSDGAPVRSVLWSGPPYQQGLFSVNAWPDIQGLVRLSGVSGSVTIDSLQISVTVVPNATTYSLYQTTITPVPEPGILTLLALGAAAVCVRVRTRAKS